MAGSIEFNKIFVHQQDVKQDKFLSRLFGIFSEEIARKWASKDTKAPYEDLGRPTLKQKGKKLCTLDFAFRDKKTGKVYVAEQKCWLEYENYKHLSLDNYQKLDCLTDSSFSKFLELADNPKKYDVFIGGKQTEISGTILLWGKVTNEGKTSVKLKYKIHDVLSLENIIENLVSWKTPEYSDLIKEKKRWCNQLFHELCPNQIN
jgi:hypothetical protein